MRPEQISKQEARAVKQSEERLLEAARKVFGTAYPNPERAARTDSGALKAAAARAHKQPLSPALLDELTWSSETFAQYQRYLREARFGRRMRWLAACAAIVVGLGAALWWGIGSHAPSPEEGPTIVEDEPGAPSVPAPKTVPESPRQEPAPEPVYQLASLDLRDRSPVRGEPEPGPADSPVLPADRLDLTVVLPIGSEDGDYEVSVLRSPARALKAVTAQAELVDRNVVLRVRLDLSDFLPGDYYWGLRRASFPWAYYRIQVR